VGAVGSDNESLRSLSRRALSQRTIALVLPLEAKAAAMIVAEVRRFFQSLRPRESAPNTSRDRLHLEMETHLVILRQRDSARFRPGHRSQATPDVAVVRRSAYA